MDKSRKKSPNLLRESLDHIPQKKKGRRFGLLPFFSEGKERKEITMALIF